MLKYKATVVFENKLVKGLHCSFFHQDNVGNANINNITYKCGSKDSIYIRSGNVTHTYITRSEDPFNKVEFLEWLKGYLTDDTSANHLINIVTGDNTKDESHYLNVIFSDVQMQDKYSNKAYRFVTSILDVLWVVEDPTYKTRSNTFLNKELLHTLLFKNEFYNNTKAWSRLQALFKALI